jgi:glycosyltransferase involved in cell wall biosynthesis
MVPAAMQALRRETHRYDVLVVRGTRVLGLPALVAARALGRAVVLQAEVNGEMTGEVYTWGTPLERGPARQVLWGAVRLRNLLLRDADAFVAMSGRIREEFLGAGVPAEKIHHIPHGVDTGHFRPAGETERRELRRHLGLAEDARLIVYTGRLIRGKGLETLVEAFAKVAARDPRARLLLVGSGAGQALSVEGDLRRRVEEQGLASRVALPGRVEDVAGRLRAADLFVFPSEFEALGISLVEAAACGLPAVGTRTGGIVDVIEDGRSGLLVPPADSAALAAAISALLEDAARRSALGLRAREVALLRFDAEDALERYRGLFREISSRSTSPPRGGAPRAGAGRPG